MRSRPAADRLREWFAATADAYEARGLRGGCPFAILGLELADENESLCTRLHEILSRWHEPLAACIVEGIAAGEFRADLAPNALADLLIAQYEGALVLAVIIRPLNRCGWRRMSCRCCWLTGAGSARAGAAAEEDRS